MVVTGEFLECLQAAGPDEGSDAKASRKGTRQKRARLAVPAVRIPRNEAAIHFG